MAKTKPTRTARWATNANRTLEPSSGQKDIGWEDDKRPPARFMNWIQNTNYQWNAWFDERVFDGVGSEDWDARGVAASAGTDNDGGTIGVSGGSSTGDGGSEIEFRVAKAGQGSGTTVRDPTTEMTLRKNGALALKNNTADLASPAAGDMQMRNGKLQTYDGNNWEPHVVQSFASTADSSEISNTTSETIFDVKHTIAAGSLRPGSTIRIRAAGVVIGYASGTLQLRCRIASAAAGPAFGVVLGDTGTWTPGGNSRAFIFDANATIDDPSGPASWRYSGLVTFGVNATYLTPADVSVTHTVDAVTGGDYDSSDYEVRVTAEWSVANASNRVQLKELVVDVN